jgi:hypothetical protein
VRASGFPERWSQKTPGREQGWNSEGRGLRELALQWRMDLHFPGTPVHPPQYRPWASEFSHARGKSWGTNILTPISSCLREALSWERHWFSSISCGHWEGFGNELWWDGPKRTGQSTDQWRKRCGG